MANSFTIPDPSQSSNLTVARTSNFQQSGSWNFFDIAKTTVNTTVGALHRYNAAGVNPYTAAFGEAVGSLFHLAPVGRRNIEKAITDLHSIATLNNALYFGFGLEDIIRSLAHSEEGATCVAICGMLIELADEDWTIDMLLELARQTAVPVKYRPSSMDLRALLRACSGVLTKSNFPLRAETFMTLVSTGSDSNYEPRGSPAPRSVAEAFLALSQISTGYIESIVLKGPPNIGWIAAFAEWLLDLRVTIQDANNAVLYTNFDESYGPQVRIIDQRDKCNERWGSDNGKEVEGVFTRECPVDFSGRLKWEECLSRTFGPDFDFLLDRFGSGLLLSNLLGSAARILQGYALLEETVSRQFERIFLHSRKLYGFGFVDNICEWLPELQSNKIEILKSANVDMESAKRTYDDCIDLIRKSCQCGLCGSSPVKVMNLERKRHYCRVVLAETIMVISTILANVDIATGLFPRRDGIEMIYYSHLSRREPCLVPEAKLEPIFYILKTIGYHSDSSGKSRLRSLLQIFSRYTGRSFDTKVVAETHRGICAYYSLFRNMSASDDSLDHVSVLPGRIQCEGVNYESIYDAPKHLLENHRGVSPSGIWSPVGAQRVSVNLLVVESSSGLSAGFRFELYDKGKLRDIVVGVKYLNGKLVKSRKFVSCDYGHSRVCCTHLERTTFHGKNITLRTFSNEVEAIAAIASFRDEFDKVFWINQGCMNCVSKAVARDSQLPAARATIIRYDPWGDSAETPKSDLQTA